MKYYSPLRYPGGKGKLYNYIASVVDKNSITKYIEPYAGGAAVAIALLYNKKIKEAHINDLDKGIYAFWMAVTQNTDFFLKKVADTTVNIDEWYKQKKIYQNPNDFSIDDLGYATFFLNRTNRSGVINGGIIGGIEQNGIYKLDARFNKKSLIQRIELIGDISKKICVTNEDTSELLSKIKLSSNHFIYFDPPYYNKGKQLYMNYYKDKDHKLLSDKIKKLRCKWMVSYDNVDIIKRLYANYRHTELLLNYSAGKTKKGQEILYYSNDLDIS